MLALEKWMDSKPPKSFMFQIFGPQVAIAARDLHEGFEFVRYRRLGSHTFSIPANLNN